MNHQQHLGINAYQPSMIGQSQQQQTHQLLTDNSLAYNSLGSYSSQQLSSYTFSFSQMDHDTKHSIFETSLPSIPTDLSSTNTHATPKQQPNDPDSHKPAANKHTKTSITTKRQKKMKFNTPNSDLVQLNYPYPSEITTATTTPNAYYHHHKQPLVASSITSSNSSSASSSPLLSSSPCHTQAAHPANNSHHHHPHHMAHMYNSQSGLAMPVYSYAYPPADSSDISSSEALINGQGCYDLLDTSLEETQLRVRLKKSKRDPIVEYDSELAESVEFELGLKKQNGPRKNSWGNLSYAELITRAIESSAEQRLTLSQIYDWIVKYVPYFKEKFDRTSSAGWKNSIRHNLSLHNRFIRVQNESSGKSSWWMINPDMSKYSLNPQATSLAVHNGLSGAEGEHGLPDSDNNNNNLNSGQEPTFTTLNPLESISHEENNHGLALSEPKAPETDPLAKSANRTMKSKSKSSVARVGKSSKSKQKTHHSDSNGAINDSKSPGSTSSLKENDLLDNSSNNHTSISSLDAGDASKLSQNTGSLIYFDLSSNNNPSQQGGLMETASLSNVSYGIDSANSSNNSILRAALQKTNNNNVSTVSTAPALVTPGIAQHNSSSAYYNVYNGHDSYAASQAFSYPNYSSSYNDKQHFISNQGVFGLSASTSTPSHSGYNNEGYFSFSNNKMSATTASSPSSTSSSSNSTSSTNPGQRYPNYYGHLTPSVNNLTPGQNHHASSQIYQNSIFKDSSQQYPSSYSSSTYYDTAANRTIHSDDNNHNNSSSASLESGENSSSNTGVLGSGSATGYADLNGFQEGANSGLAISMKPVGCYYS